MQMKKVRLDEKERRLLRTLARGGVMSPSRVSAETLILPGETLKLLKGLADVGLVLLRDDPDSIDGQLVVLTAQARDFLALET
jgi:hypothetical protein